MMNSVMEVLNSLGITPVIQFIAIAIGAMFIYRYFTDRG